MCKVSNKNPLLCPSAQPEMAHAVIFGIVGGSFSEPRVGFVDEPQPVTEELLSLPESIQPTEVFRIAAPCAERQCQHFVVGACNLARRLVQILPTTESQVPSCSIRRECRWWVQEGKAACLRCPQIVTRTIHPSGALCEAAIPLEG